MGKTYATMTKRHLMGKKLVNIPQRVRKNVQFTFRDPETGEFFYQ